MDQVKTQACTEPPLAPDVAIGDSSSWQGLRSRFLVSQSAEYRARAVRLSAQMIGELNRWAERYPTMRRVRIEPLAMSVAAASPFCSVEALISTARVSLWVFALDDVFDEGLVPQTELMSRARSYLEILRNHHEADSSDDTLASALVDVIDDLQAYPLYDRIGNEWRMALTGTIYGMLREHLWRLDYQDSNRIVLPTYKDYLANGLYSIGGPPHVWAAIITTDDSSTPDHLEHLRSMERVASICVRLANDLQSHAKEITEGNVNGLVILSQALQQHGLSAGAALQAAVARVKAEIANGLQTLTQMQADSGTATGIPEAAVANIARFVCEFYLEHDYHTFAAGKEPV
jgi:hypothetical protein